MIIQSGLIVNVERGYRCKFFNWIWKIMANFALLLFCMGVGKRIQAAYNRGR